MLHSGWPWSGSLIFVGLLALGCGSPPSTLTPEQLKRQQEEDKIDLKAEDQNEAAFQKKQRQR